MLHTKEELKKIYKVLGVLTERYRKDEDRKPIGYEAIDAERKKEAMEEKGSKGSR